MENTLNHIFNIIAFFSPFLIICFLALMSAFNQDIKALILIIGIIFMSVIHKEINQYIPIDKDEKYRELCTLFNYLDPPANSLAILSYIFIYLLLPMIYNRHFNPVIITAFTIFLGLEAWHKMVIYKCYNRLSVGISILIGLTFGSLMFHIIYAMGKDYYNLLYFNISKNNRVQCSRQNTTEYSCNFYDDEGKQIIDEATGLEILADSNAFGDEVSARYRSKEATDILRVKEHELLQDTLNEIKGEIDVIQDHSESHSLDD